MNRLPIFSPNDKRSTGQGLLEFALVLPILLLVLMAIIDFGWILAVYSNIFNASREGTRYGVTRPRDCQGIELSARQKITLVPVADVSIQIWYDRGPGTEVFTDTASVEIGDRILVDTQYTVMPITPILQPIIGEMDLHTISARTIQTLGDVVTPPGGGGGELPPNPWDNTPTPTAEITGTATATATPLSSPTPTGTPNATPTSTPVPIEITEPLEAGELIVDGGAQPGATLSMRDVQSGLLLNTQVDNLGYFVFNLQQPLIAGHTIVVQGYGQQDTAVVQGGTPTPTPTATPSPTPTPSSPFIMLDPACGNTGEQTITVRGYNWPTTGQAEQIGIYWDATGAQTLVAVISPAQTNFTTTFTIQAARGTYTVLAQAEKSNGNPSNSPAASDTEDFVCPCDVTFPNLQISGLSLRDPAPGGTYETVWVNVSLANTGDADVTSLFWVDLFADADLSQPLPEQASADWVAINGLAAQSSITFTMYIEEGFATTGDHTLVAMADTWEQIAESDETDNVSQPLTVTIGTDNPTPTPSPTPEGTPESPSRIEGTTNVEGVPQSGVDVYVYDLDARLVASTRSGTNGFYWVDNLTPGDYVVVGQMRMGDRLFRGQVGPVTCLPGQTEVGVNILLTEL
jgi:hypothetical protein